MVKIAGQMLLKAWLSFLSNRRNAPIYTSLATCTKGAWLLVIWACLVLLRGVFMLSLLRACLRLLTIGNLGVTSVVRGVFTVTR